jgi:hypothetical protein
MPRTIHGILYDNATIPDMRDQRLHSVRNNANQRRCEIPRSQIALRCGFGHAITRIGDPRPNQIVGERPHELPAPFSRSQANRTGNQRSAFATHARTAGAVADHGN